MYTQFAGETAVFRPDSRFSAERQGKIDVNVAKDRIGRLHSGKAQCVLFKVADRKYRGGDFIFKLIERFDIFISFLHFSL